MLAPASVRELWTWFPDPWHKKRHHKRRLVTVPFTRLVARVLEPGGTWRIATDWDDYADVAAEVLAASPYVEGGPVPRHEARALTRFESKGVAAGRTIHDSRRQTYTDLVTEPTHAETLGITEGSVVWVVADSVEATALLDPLPEGAETVDEPIDRMDAAVLLADDLASLEVRLDEVLPSLGSTPVAWISYPSGIRASSTATLSWPWSTSTAGPSAPRCGSTRRGPRSACASSEPSGDGPGDRVGRSCPLREGAP